MNSSLSSRTFHSAKWVYGGHAAIAVSQLTVGAVLARILDPSTFGLVAAATIMTRLVFYFSQLGIPSALIQRPHLEIKDIQTGLALALLTGTALAGVCVVLAPASAYLVSSSEAAPVTAMMGLAFIISAPGVVASALLRRAMQYRSMVLVEVLSYVLIYTPLVLALALDGRGVWSIVIAQLGQLLAQSTGYVVLAGVTTPRFHKGRTLPLVSFGGKVSAIGFLEYVSFQLDVVAIAKFAGPVPLGNYNRATTLVAPLQQLSATGSRVLISAFARADSKSLRNAYLDLVTITVPFLGAMAAFLSTESHQVVRLMLGPDWGLAADLLPILSLAVLAQSISQYAATMSEARGILNPKIAIQLIQLCLLLILLGYCALAEKSAVWFAAAWAVSEALRSILYVKLMRSSFNIGFVSQLLAMSGVFFPFVIAISVHALCLQFGSTGDLTSIAVGASMPVAVLTMAYLPGPLRQALSRRAPSSVSRILMLR